MLLAILLGRTTLNPPVRSIMLGRFAQQAKGAHRLQSQQQGVAPLVCRIALLNRRPAAGKWSVPAILAHLAEDELASSWRYRQMIEQNGATPLEFDQDEWSRLGNNDSWSATEVLSVSRLLREADWQTKRDLVGAIV